jgi:lipoprotein-anchoring transpeptidase ErfK/SrfK
MIHRLSLFTVALFFVTSVHDLSAQGTASPTLVQPNVIVSVRDQKLMVVANGGRAATYPVSTSKFGLGDNWGSMATPIGLLQVAQKIGDHAPTGAVFHNRRFTGEILQPNAPGRDPVITRIIWLRGLQAENAHAFNRCIYIHGTPEEKLIGKPASYGCIRMKSSDVASLYAQLPLGAIVQITSDKLPKLNPAAKGVLAQTQPPAPAMPSPTHAVFTADSSKPGAEKAIITPLPAKAPAAPTKKSTVLFQNGRA